MKKAKAMAYLHDNKADSKNTNAQVNKYRLITPHTNVQYVEKYVKP